METFSKFIMFLILCFVSLGFITQIIIEVFFRDNTQWMAAAALSVILVLLLYYVRSAYKEWKNTRN